MLYNYAIVAYEKDTKYLYISIMLSELIHNSLLELLGDQTTDFSSEKCYVKRNNILDIFRISGIKMPTFYYYDWYIERINEAVEPEIDLNIGDEEDITRDG